MNNDQVINFLKKLDTLPEEAQLYFNSELMGQCFAGLKEKYKIKDDSLYDVFYDVVLADFDFSILDKTLASKELVLDVLGQLFFPVAAFIDKDVKTEIENRGGKISDYQKIIQSFQGLIDDENFSTIEELADLQESTFDPAKEENAALNILSDQLRDVLSETNQEILADLNGAIVYLLINKPDFGAKANKTLLASQEIITEKGIVVDGKLQPGTVERWLKDFISENGSEMFNVVVLSKYLATANNAKNLGENDRRLVRRLLKLYRNLMFYPDSMAGLKIEEWEIIPMEKEAKEVPLRAKVAAATPTPAKPKAVIIEKKEVAPAAPVKPADDLEKMLSNYPAGSLERRALEQEIKKRQTKI